MHKLIALPAGVLALTLCLTPVGFAAEPVADFYKGKTVFLQIGTTAGGAYDLLGRVVGRHIGKHIPGNPTVVVQNVPGGTGIALANQLATTAPKDGTVFGLLNNGIPTTPLLEPNAPRFDPQKFVYLGSPTREVQVLAVWHAAVVKTLDDLFVKELIVGGLGPGSASGAFPMVTNAVIGTRYKIVKGYSGGAESKLAMERGEVEGNAALAWGAAKSAYADLLERHQLRIVGQYGFKPHPELKDVPLFPTGKTEEDRQIFQILYSRQDYGRPFMAPPDLPAERAQALRAAFDRTMRDPDFITDAAAQKLDLDPVSGEELQRLTDEIYKAPPQVAKRLQAILNGG